MILDMSQEVPRVERMSSRVPERLSDLPQPAERNSNRQHSTAHTRSPALVFCRRRSDRKFSLYALDTTSDDDCHLLHRRAHREELGLQIVRETQGSLLMLC